MSTCDCRQVSSWRLFQVLYNGLGLVHLFWLLFGTVIIIPPAMLEGFYMRCTHTPPDVWAMCDDVWNGEYNKKFCLNFKCLYLLYLLIDSHSLST